MIHARLGFFVLLAHLAAALVLWLLVASAARAGDVCRKPLEDPVLIQTQSVAPMPARKPVQPQPDLDALRSAEACRAGIDRISGKPDPPDAGLPTYDILLHRPKGN